MTDVNEFARLLIATGAQGANRRHTVSSMVPSRTGQGGFPSDSSHSVSDGVSGHLIDAPSDLAQARASVVLAAVDATAVVSWSGGKDSGMAFQRAVNAGLSPRYLLSMMTEDGRRSRSHGLRLAVLEAQANALGCCLVTRSCSWENYESRFTDALTELRMHGAEVAVFGDLDTPNLAFGERVGAAAGLAPFHPLYGQHRVVLTRELIGSGWRATIVAVRDKVLPAALLGSSLTGSIIDAISDLGADPLGEGGEYHTVLTDGPAFAQPVELSFGGGYLRDGVWVLDTRVA